MGNVITPTINTDIILDEDRIRNMPDNIKQPLLITITMAEEKYNCSWRELQWSVKYPGGQPVICVKPKGNSNEEKD